MEILTTIGLEPKLLVMQAISFLALYWVVKRFLVGPIAGMVEARNKEIAERLANTERDERAMEAVRTEYERRIAEIETEARDRIQQAMTEARRIADEIKDEARREAEAIRDRSLAQIDREKEKALKEIQDQIVDLTIDAAAKLSQASLDDEGHRRLVRGFIDELESTSSN